MYAYVKTLSTFKNQDRPVLQYKIQISGFFRQEVMGGKVSTPVVMVTGAGAVGPSGWYVLQFAKIPTAPCSLTTYQCSVSWLASLFFLNLLGWIKPFLRSQYLSK